MSPPRIIVPGATTSIVRRTSFRKAFLAPWHPLVSQIWLYALADAAREHKVLVHMTSLVVTHHHTDVTPTRDNLPEFTRQLHADVSCALNTLLAHERYDAPRHVFDKRPASYIRLLDAEAQASQLTYDYLNPAAAGLVADPRQMPGQVMDFGHWSTDGFVIKRPPVYFGKDRASELQLGSDVPPLLLAEFDGDREAAIYHMRQLSKHGLKSVRDNRKWPPLGAQRLRRLHPYDEPRTLADAGGQRIPTFRIGARGFRGRETHIRACVETTAFREEHELRRLQRLDGADPPFPAGTYGMRVFHGARVAEPAPDALVTAPGPLPRDGQWQDAPLRPREELLEEVRAGWDDEVEAIVEHSDLNFRAATPDSGGDSSEEEQRPEPETVHKSDPRPNWRTRPRRTITRRDARKGRPKKKPGSDPPPR